MKKMKSQCEEKNTLLNVMILLITTCLLQGCISPPRPGNSIDYQRLQAGDYRKVNPLKQPRPISKFELRRLEHKIKN